MMKGNSLTRLVSRTPPPWGGSTMHTGKLLFAQLMEHMPPMVVATRWKNGVLLFPPDLEHRLRVTLCSPDKRLPMLE